MLKFQEQCNLAGHKEALETLLWNHFSFSKDIHHLSLLANQSHADFDKNSYFTVSGHVNSSLRTLLDLYVTKIDFLYANFVDFLGTVEQLTLALLSKIAALEINITQCCQCQQIQE